MSSISALTNSALNARPSTSAAPASSGSGGASSMDFMKLLMTQMQNQNPMDPTSGTDFMTQIAQFTQLDGINQLNTNITNMLMLQGLTQGAGLIGKTVSYTNSTGGTARGTVGSVAMVSGKPQLMISGVQVDLSQVKTIEAGPKTTNNA